MRGRLPGRLDDLGGLAQVVAPGEQPAGDDGGRHEVRGELDGLERLLGRGLGLAGLVALGGRREQHGLLPAGGMLVHQAQGRAALHGLGGGGPLAVGALRLQNRLVRPGDARREPGGLGGVGAGGALVLAAAGLDEQAAQAEHAGLGVVRHALEGALGRVPVAGDLGGLGLEEERQRLAAE
ncbi:hypothetical protein CHKEEEPN_4771 [Methylorubrum podarium]|nr:hypothetical protein CHKEEEPN_4771 [Methylorubrum podarium]